MHGVAVWDHAAAANKFNKNSFVHNIGHVLAVSLNHSRALTSWRTFLQTMGRKCFVPRCNTGYKSCQQKFSLFSAPKDKACPKLWRHAIPRKDRILEPSDHICERNFEPRFVWKTWTSEYNGNVLASTAHFCAQNS
ncbi:hypothetical protein HPB49_025317 [Dermacentor silvarum]|uniref:Uncharacterized protein n=1 Tax=Dermacentor silvarum TaxID=543639 RepID=A0ACB8D9J5_DERSI|nr:hypothetical protein HPB49_025317 [Dermacentor silvarum]